MRSRVHRSLASAVLGGIAVLVAAAPAVAHVTVNPSEANQGGFARLAFRVPNEKDDASTTRVAVQFPTDHPIAFVSVQPVPGWTYRVTKQTLAEPIRSDDGEVTEAVSQIVWSGGEIKPGEFQEFPVSVGPLPATDSLEFKAVQTYSDGESVRWIEPTPASGEEPEHPAPVLKLAAGGSGHGGTAEPMSETNDDDSNTLAIVALVVGAAGLLGAIASLARGRRAPAQ
jgi:uncharacterized protein YcnI